MKEAEEKDRVEIRSRLEIWDDDESDETFYVDRYVFFLFHNTTFYIDIFMFSAQWRRVRQRRLAAEEAADAESRVFEEREAENLRRESEAFLARQMDEMQALAEEQRKAGLLLDDGAPVKLNVSMAHTAEKDGAGGGTGGKERAAVFGQEEDEDEAQKKRKVPLVKLDFSVAEGGEKTKERLERIRASVPSDKETLFKAKVRWDGLSDVGLISSRFAGTIMVLTSFGQLMIDRKLEPLVKRQMMKYLGELEDDDLVMFVLEHLKDHKGPQKLVEGLEPVRFIRMPKFSGC
jgi:RNA-binding protein 25